MDEAFIGEIRLVGFSYDPIAWVACDGRRMGVKEYTPLYALIGCTFGGDGTTYFQLPKLEAPMKGLHYIICTQGLWPSRP